MSRLVIAGTGINAAAHITQEARTWIESAGRVFFLLNASPAVDWLRNLRPDASDLGELYTTYTERRRVYRLLAETILESLEGGEDVCAVFYGHPMIFVTPSLQLIQQAQDNGHRVTVCAGISAEDCLFADLGVDPASRGCQSYEATDFLLQPRRFDTSSGLILWQIGVIGNLTSRIQEQHPRGMSLLQQTLLQHYPAAHRVYIYEAATTADETPRVQVAEIQHMTGAEVGPASTLYVPPATAPQLDEAMLDALNLSRDDLL
jgi:uncharacterized protein YabN with tetrapyrrole methylase and pyrophosphatase domain